MRVRFLRLAVPCYVLAGLIHGGLAGALAGLRLSLAAWRGDIRRSTDAR